MAKKRRIAKPEVATEIKKTTSSKGANRRYTQVVFFMLAALIFFPPFYRGLFFDSNMFVYHTMTAIVLMLFWLDKINRHDYEFFKTPLDFIILIYVFIYTLTNFVAVDQGKALYVSLRILNYFMIYWLVYQAVKDFHDYKNILRTIVFSGVGVALIGILAAGGQIDYIGAFIQNRAIASTFQYTNATGTFLAMAVLLAAVLWLLETHLFWRCLYLAAGFLMTVVVIGTYSKGSWLVFFIGITLFLLIMPKKSKLTSIYFVFFAIFPAVIAANKFLPLLSGKETRATAWLWILPGMVIAVAGEFLWSWWKNRQEQTKKKKFILIAGVVLAVVIGVSAWWQLSTGQPESGEKTKNPLLNRLVRLVDFKNPSYTSRISIFGWGIDIFKDYPLLGTGGGGFNALYHQYQDHLRWTMEVHNHYIQVMVEAGLLGLISFLAIWGYLLFGLGRRRKLPLTADEDEDGLNRFDYEIATGGTAVALYTLLLHAALDFDLSLGAISVVLFTLGALLNWLLVRADALPRIDFKQKAIQIPIGAICIGILLFTGLSFRAGHNDYTKGSLLLSYAEKQTDIAAKIAPLTQSAQFLESAVSNDSLNGYYYADLALNYAYQYMYSGEQVYKDKALAALEKSEKLAFYDIKSANRLYQAVAFLQEPELLIKRAEDFIEINPMDINAYYTALYTRNQMADAAKQRGDLVTAEEQAKAMLVIENRLKQQIDKSDMTVGWQGERLSLNERITPLLENARAILQQ